MTRSTLSIKLSTQTLNGNFILSANEPQSSTSLIKTSDMKAIEYGFNLDRILWVKDENKIYIHNIKVDPQGQVTDESLVTASVDNVTEWTFQDPMVMNKMFPLDPNWHL